jgi:hypothetical protein
MAAVAERIFQHLTQVGMIDNDFPYASFGEPFKMPNGERFAARPQKRFRTSVRKGAHTFTSPGSQNHGLHGFSFKEDECIEKARK